MDMSTDTLGSTDTFGRTDKILPQKHLHTVYTTFNSSRETGKSDDPEHVFFLVWDLIFDTLLKNKTQEENTQLPQPEFLFLHYWILK